MPVASATRVALLSICATRLQNQGHLLDNSQLGALVDDIEFTVNANSGTVLTDVGVDLGLWPDPAQSGQ
jgi:hypothetical protein